MTGSFTRGLWLGLVAWQLIWHGLGGSHGLGYGWGAGLLLFVAVAWLTPGVWRLLPRSLIWALFFSLPLMMVAAMELVARPQDWLFSATQLALALGFQGSAILHVRALARRRPSAAD